MTAALIGTSAERNTTRSRRKESLITTPMNSGNRLPGDVAQIVVNGGDAPDAHLETRSVEHRRHDVVAQRFDELFGLHGLGCRVRNHEHHGRIGARGRKKTEWAAWREGEGE